MNFIDRAISYVAPRTALNRARARMALEFIESRRASENFRYEAAAAGRRAHGWYAGSADANVELMGALIWLRDRSRELARNNPYASKSLEELTGNIVGTGIVP